MNTGKAIYNILKDNIAVSSMVGTRISPNVMEQTSDFPFIVYDVTSDDPEGQKDSVALLDTATVMVSAYCRSYKDSNKLGNYIRTALDRVNGLNSGVDIQSINFDGYDDIFDDTSGEDGIYRKALNFQIRILNSFNNIYSTNFDGVDDYVNIDGAGSVVDSSNGTISLWTKLGAVSGGVSWFKTYVDGNNSIQLLWHNSNEEITLIWQGGGSTTIAVSSENIEDDGLWHHIAGTWDKSGDEVKLYIDGTLEDTSSSMGTFTGTPSLASIGNNTQSGNYFYGNIDEFSLFDRTLTAAKVTTLYNDGLPYTVAPDTGLVGWWRMGDGNLTGNPIATFPTIPDETGNNDGTMTNMTSTDFEADVPE